MKKTITHLFLKQRMFKICLSILIGVFSHFAHATISPCPYNESFTSFADNATTFTSNGETFTVTTLTNSTVHINKYAGGWSGVDDNDYLDNADANQSNIGASFKISSATVFQLRRFYLFVSNVGQSNLGTSGTISIVGKNGSNTIFNISVTSSSWNGNFGFQNGFNLIDMAVFGGQDNTFANITEFTITTSANSNMDYVALDGMQWITSAFSVAPSVTTSAATSVTLNSATLNGSINANNMSTNDSIQYSTSSTLASGVTTVVASPATSSGSSSTSILASISGLSSATTYYFRVKASNCNGNKYGSILSFTTQGPTVSILDNISTFTTCSGKPSGVQTFSVSGSNLNNNIVINVPTGFEISTTLGSGYTNSITLNHTGGAVNSTTIFVRLSELATGTPNGDISITSVGAQSKSIAVNGAVTNTPSSPVLTSEPICNSGIVTFHSTARQQSNNQYKLYDYYINGNVVGVDLTTPNITQTTDFWATITENGCESPRAKVSAVVLEPVIYSFGASACDFFVFGDDTLNQSGIYYDTLVSAAGCDSVVTLDISIYSSPFVPEVINNVRCGEGTLTLDIVQVYDRKSKLNCRGCDTDILWYDSNLQYITTTDNFTTPNLTETTTYFAKAYNNNNGCESNTVEINAFVKTLNMTVSKIGNDTLSSDQGKGATYQWIDCSDNSVIVGATEREFIAVKSGNYAVIVEINGCVDTSACYQVTKITTGINASETISATIHPNPTSGKVTIVVPSTSEAVIYNTIGEKEYLLSLNEGDNTVNLNLATGVYFVQINNQVVKLIKQ